MTAISTETLCAHVTQTLGSRITPASDLRLHEVAVSLTCRRTRGPCVTAPLDPPRRRDGERRAKVLQQAARTVSSVMTLTPQRNGRHSVIRNPNGFVGILYILMVLTMCTESVLVKDGLCLVVTLPPLYPAAHSALSHLITNLYHFMIP